MNHVDSVVHSKVLASLFLRMGQSPFHVSPKAILMLLNYEDLKVRWVPFLNHVDSVRLFPCYDKLIPKNSPKPFADKPKGHSDVFTLSKIKN